MKIYDLKIYPFPALPLQWPKVIGICLLPSYSWRKKLICNPSAIFY